MSPQVNLHKSPKKSRLHNLEAALNLLVLNKVVRAETLGDWSGSPEGKTVTFCPRTLALSAMVARISIVLTAHHYFLPRPISHNINATTNTITITPVQIPALKMPAMASQLDKVVSRKNAMIKTEIFFDCSISVVF